MKTFRFFVAVVLGSLVLQCAQDGSGAADALPTGGWAYTELWRGTLAVNLDSPTLDVSGFYEVEVMYDVNLARSCNLPSLLWRLSQADTGLTGYQTVNVRFTPLAPLLQLVGPGSNACTTSYLVLGIQPRN